VSRDTAEVECGHVVSARGERRVDGLPDESPGDHAGEGTHSVAALVQRVSGLAEPIKPRLRGWLHAGMVPAALIAGVVLICLARTPQAVLACAVYSVTAWLLYATNPRPCTASCSPGCASIPAPRRTTNAAPRRADPP
jgi:hemolysin III